MGGKPRCFLLSLALPASLTGRWLDEFLRGLRRASAKFQCHLAGGDTTCRDMILINVTVVGEVRTGRAVLRSGARPGDLVYVSGRLGEAERGLRLLKRSKGPASQRNPLTKKHLYPEPHLALGQWLAKNRLASAMMDLSDGLSSDLPRLCAASNVGAQVETAKIPLVRSSGCNRDSGIGPLQLALHGGDDYELLFTVPTGKAGNLPPSLGGVRLSRIGTITSEKKLVLVDKRGHEQPLNLGGWDPFRAGHKSFRANGTQA
jgi:thiamine-monophosphate kinase